jgi:CRP-like cAMP-binding protein
MATAMALARCTIFSVEKLDMVRELHARPAFADRFLSHMATRNIRIEETSSTSSSTRAKNGSLARCCSWRGTVDPKPLIGRFRECRRRRSPRWSGTTRSRVTFFMNKFRELGFIKYNGGLKINNSPLSVVLRE